MTSLPVMAVRGLSMTSTLKPTAGPKQGSAGPSLHEPWQCRAGKASARPLRKEPPLPRLQKLLGRLSRERRLQILRDLFSQDQRVLLERWILEQRASAASAPPASGGPLKRSSVSIEAGDQTSVGTPGKRRHCKEDMDGLPGAPSEMQMKLSARKCPSVKEQSQNKGIATRRCSAQVMYSATVLVERLELRSKQVSDLQLALSIRRAFLEVKAEVLEQLRLRRAQSTDEMAQVLAETLPTAVLKALGAEHLTPEEAGLFFRVNTAAKLWIGSSLCGPLFHLRNLQSGLEGWAIMQKARGWQAINGQRSFDTTWERVRAAHLQLWGRHTGTTCSDLAERLDDLAQRHSVRRERLLQVQKLRTLCLSSRREAEASRKRAVEARKAARAARAAAKVEAQIRKILHCWSSVLAKSKSLARKTAAAAARRPECRGRQKQVSRKVSLSLSRAPRRVS